MNQILLDSAPAINRLYQSQRDKATFLYYLAQNILHMRYVCAPRVYRSSCKVSQLAAAAARNEMTTAAHEIDHSRGRRYVGRTELYG